MNDDLAVRAARAMARVNPQLEQQYAAVINFLSDNREYAQTYKTDVLFSDLYLIKYANSFSNSRISQSPSEPSTISDPMVRVILEKYWSLDSSESMKAVNYHNKAMGAENIIGNLLERYIASVLEPLGWVWCSGSVVKAIDFIFEDDDGNWSALQVKNRDNSENSSSKGVRKGTKILHWFRTFSKKPGDNWRAFPIKADVNLNENGFQDYVAQYLTAIQQRRRHL